MDDLPRRFVIRESSHRIHNPFTSEKLATLGRALYLSPRNKRARSACGSGEMLCTWARDHRLTGTGVDISTAFIGAARARAIELDVADRVTFIHGDAAGHVAERPVGVSDRQNLLPTAGCRTLPHADRTPGDNTLEGRSCERPGSPARRRHAADTRPT